MFDLQSISSIAPIGDLVFGLGLILVSIAIANLLIVRKLLAHRTWPAYTLLGVTSVGLFGTLLALAIHPPRVYATVLLYIVVFGFVGLITSWRKIGWCSAFARISTGTACMLIALGVAYWVAYVPR